MLSRKDHWDRVYANNETEDLGWYEPDPEPSIRLIQETGVRPSETILDVGSGSSTLINRLLALGYLNLVATDISVEAVRRAQAQLVAVPGSSVRWVLDDVTHPTALPEVSGISVWHDRALLHFLRSEEDRKTYRELIDVVLKKDGWVIIAAFAKEGAVMCSGLRVRNYDIEMLCEFMGPSFELVDHFDHLYVMPSGELRPYIYTLFRGHQERSK